MTTTTLPTIKTTTFHPGSLLGMDIRVGDVLERSLGPVKIDRVERSKGGWNSQILMVRLATTCGERMQFAAGRAFTVPVTREIRDYKLNDRQISALRSVAAMGDGVSIHKGTANALVSRGLATITGDAIMGAGVTLTLTPEGITEARRLWDAYDAQVFEQRGTPSSVAAAALARIARVRS